MKEYFIRFKKNISKKHMIIILGILSLSLFVLIFAGSYAFFTSTVSSKDYIVYTGNLKVDFEHNGNTINLSNTIPMTNQEGRSTEGYTFNVKNTGTIPAKYQVRLELASDNEIPIDYIKYAYQKTQDESTNVSSPVLTESKLLSDLNSGMVLFKDEQIGVNKTDTINLKLWIDIDAPNDIQGKTFKGKIVIDAMQDVEDGYVLNTKPVIELNKDENGNIDYIIPLNSTYEELGVLKVTDDKDKLIPSDVTITGTVDTTQVGSNTITYSITDTDNNTTTVERTIYVGDEESLNIKHSISDVLAMYTQQEQSSNEAVVCSHIYGDGDLYLDCKVYAGMQEALNYRYRGVIILIKNLDRNKQISIPSTHDIILELNGNTITTSSNAAIGNSGSLVVNNGSIVSNDATNASGICNNGNYLELNNVSVEGPYGVGCFNNANGITVINNSNITATGNGYTGINLNPYNYPNRKITINNTDVTSSSGQAFYIGGNGQVEIDGGTFTSTSGITVNNNSSGTININGGTFTSTSGVVVNDNSTGTININGGTFISNNNITINNSSSGTINITQTDIPIYITSKAEAWKPVIYNNGENGIINIKGQQANACTNNANDTTSGLCVYAEGNKDPSSNNGNLAVVNGAGKAIYIDGGTYYGCRTSVCNNSSGKIYIMNAILNSDSLSLINNTGEVYICNSTLNKSIYQYDNESAKIYYANDVVFASGTNTPNIAYGTFISNYTCPAEWTIE